MRVAGWFALILASGLTPAPFHANAASRPGCNLYVQLDRVCRCPGGTNYLHDYGLKYCRRFRAAIGWSPAGADWRDQTLICLQEQLKRIAPAYTRSCDCERLQAAAFETHGFCYTQHASSFCTLPRADVDRIYSLIDPADIRSGPGLRQGLSIAWSCLSGKAIPAP